MDSDAPNTASTLRAKAVLFTMMVIGILMIVAFYPSAAQGDTRLENLREKYGQKVSSSVDHSQFAILKAKFSKPQDVTAACATCHNGRHKEVMKSSHWNWASVEYVPGRGLRSLGKRNILNNFCIGVESNEQSCAKCHIGYGYKDSGFDFQNPLNVDCLACHDGSDAYVKANGQGGLPEKTVNLSLVAQSVGKPRRANCGTCHFFGGGGNNVKHGDLEKSMFEPSRDIDVHMASEGTNMQCVACHTAEKHQMLGKVYSVSSMNRNRAKCETCHGDLPHRDDTINKHTAKVACQACHIPTYAKANPTKMEWDWSTAGKLRNGKPYEVKEKDGTDSYMSIKGSFKWGKNLQPEYAWFNGNAGHYLLGDKIDPSQTVRINHLLGDYDDPDSKIIPVKVHRANQIYDTENLTLIQPKTFSSKPGDGGYWKEFDWNNAAQAGMKAVNLPYSGHYGFAKTEMVWPLNHMVSAKDQVVKCGECHTRANSRLSNLKGFYMPGRDRNNTADNLGKFLIVATLLGVIAHGGSRFIAGRRNRNNA